MLRHVPRRPSMSWLTWSKGCGYSFTYEETVRIRATTLLTAMIAMIAVLYVILAHCHSNNCEHHHSHLLLMFHVSIYLSSSRVCLLRCCLLTVIVHFLFVFLFLLICFLMFPPIRINIFISMLIIVFIIVTDVNDCFCLFLNLSVFFYFYECKENRQVLHVDAH